MAIANLDSENNLISPFTDIKGHKFEEAINKAYGNGRINGYPDKTFRPEGKITRAEAVKILNNFANIAPEESENKIKFKDIDKNHWAYGEIMAATK